MAYIDDRHKDGMGFLRNSLQGTTQWTDRNLRNTGVVLPHIADGDSFSYNIQLNHDKKLGSVLDSFHIHFIPTTLNNGTITFTYEWGWFSFQDVIPDTLPNTGTTYVDVSGSTNQWKHTLYPIVSDMSYTGTEKYSSFFLIKISRISSTGAVGEIALLGADVHYITDREGSIYEAHD